MSFYVIKVGEGETRSGIGMTAEIDIPIGNYDTTLNITVDNIRIHLDTVDTVELKRVLKKRKERRKAKKVK